MRILFITHYYAPDSGAAANRLTRLAAGLAARGHEVTVLAPMPHYPTGRIAQAYRGRWQMSEQRDGVRVIRVWLWARPGGGIAQRLLSQLSFMVNCGLRGLSLPRADVIFIENQPIFTGLAGWFISRMQRRPYVLNLSDYWPEYLYVSGTVSQHSLIYRIFEAITNLTQQAADHIVIMWPGLANGIQQRLSSPPPMSLIYNAVDLARFRPDAANGTSFLHAHDLPDKRYWITFLGGLGPHIDLETMLKAAAHFRDRDDVGVLFVGTGAQKDKLLSALRGPELDHCYWIEWIDADEVPAFWSASTLHMWALQDNPLDRLRMQAKAYEALASGTPITIAAEGFMADLLRDEGIGLAVRASDDHALAQAINGLLADDARRQDISRRARAYAEAHYDPQQVITCYEAILKHTAASE